MLLVKVVKACIVRCALLLHITLTVWRVTVDLKNDMYWLLFCATVPFFIEGFYTVIRRRGDDFKLFTPCFFFYLMTTIPCVWLLELRKTDVYLTGEEEQLFNSTDNEKPLDGLEFNINPNTWTILIEELLLYLLIVGRWLLPRGEVTREQLSELLFAFIGIASDIMEMFSLFGEQQVRSNRILSYCLLAVWSLSVIQFCMTLTVTHQPRKAKNIRTIRDTETDEEKPRISHEIIAIFLSMIMQDIPFVTVRLYTIITYNLITYSLIFFTSKNCLVILLLLYKIAVLLQKRYCPENEPEEMVEDKELYTIGESGRRKRYPPNFNDTGSDSTGGSKEKEKMEKYYKQNEKDTGHDNHVLDSPSLDSGTPKALMNEKTPLKVPKFPNHKQPNQASTPNLKKRSPKGETGSPKLNGYRPRPSSSKMAKNPPKGQTDQAAQEAKEKPEPDSVIASGFGWISSKPNEDNKKDDNVITDTLS